MTATDGGSLRGCSARTPAARWLVFKFLLAGIRRLRLPLPRPVPSSGIAAPRLTAAGARAPASDSNHPGVIIMIIMMIITVAAVAVTGGYSD